MKTSTPRNRLLVIGWDAADWNMIDPLLRTGEMPNLQRLLSSGVRGNLKSIEPKLSPILWTSIATGKVAGKHGILNFVEPRPDGEGLRVSQSTSRKTKAVWNILSQNNLNTNVIGWYASHPAEPIRGSVVTNLLHENFQEYDQYQTALLEHTVHPVDMSTEVAASRIHFQHFPSDLLRKLLPRVNEIGVGDERVSALKKRMSYAISIEHAAIIAMGKGDWDCTFVFFDAIDTMGHLFMQYRKPRMNHVSEKEIRWFGEVMDAVYKWHDDSLGRLLAAAGDEVNVLIVSDHGFHIDTMRPRLENLPPERRMELESSWHRNFGIIIGSGDGFKAGAQPAPCTILDITPTCLSLMGLPVGKDMDGRVIREIIRDAKVNEPVESWDHIAGEDGLHPEEMRSNPIETSASIKQLMDLGYLAAIPEQTREQIDLVERESLFNLAVSYTSFRRYDEATPLFAQLFEQHQDIDRYGICLAECYMERGDFSSAVEVLEKIRLRDAENIPALLMLCNGYTELGQVNKAEELTRMAEKRCAHKNEYVLGLANLAYLQFRFADAEILARRALNLNRQDPLIHVLLSKVAIALGKFEPGAEHALDALEITQAIPEAHLQLGLALAWLGDEESALASLKTALLYKPDLLEAWALSCLISGKRGDRAATTYFRNMLEEKKALNPGADFKKFPFGAVDYGLKFNQVL